MLCCAGAPINCRRSPSLGGEWAAKQDALLPLQCTEWKAGTVIPHALLSTAIAMPSLAAETSHSVSSIILAAGSVSAIFFLLSGVCWIKAASITVRDPHDADGIADHVGGALLSFGSGGHLGTLAFGSSRHNGAGRALGIRIRCLSRLKADRTHLTAFVDNHA